MIGYRVRRTDDQLRLVVEQESTALYSPLLSSCEIRQIRGRTFLCRASPRFDHESHELHESRDYWKDDRISRPTVPMITFASSLRSIYCVVLSPLSLFVKFVRFVVQLSSPCQSKSDLTTNLTNYTNQRLLEG